MFAHILCVSIEYNKPKYKSLTSVPVFELLFNFSSTTSRDDKTLYWKLSSSSGFKHDIYLGEFWKDICINIYIHVYNLLFQSEKSIR